MLSKNSVLFDNEDDSSSMIDILSSPIFLPITDHNINSFLKNQKNKFINVSSKYENDEENGIKLEAIFERHNAYIFENLFKFSAYEIDNVINNEINLDDPKVQKISQNLINKTTNKDIIIEINSFSEKNKHISDKKIFLTVYPKKYLYSQK